MATEIRPAVRPATDFSIPVGLYPVGIVYDNEDKEVFVANSGSVNLTVVSTLNDSPTASVPLAGQSWISSEVLDGGSDYVYAAGEWFGACAGCDGPWVDAVNASSRQIAATNTSLEGVDTIDQFDCLAYDSVINDIYACDSVGRIVVLSAPTDTILGYVPAGSNPSAIAYDVENGDLYVANEGSDNVTVIDAADEATLASISVGSQPDSILFDPDDGEVYVANNASDNVSIISAQTNTVVHTTSVGCGPDALGYVPYDQTVFVADGCSDNLTGISEGTNATVSSEPVGVSPESIAYDASNDQIYVANEGSDNVTAINVTLIVESAPFAVTFSQSGLPPDGAFAVTLGDFNQGYSTNTSLGGTVQFLEADGSYNYTIATDTSSFLPVQTNGSVVVDGANVNVPTPFRFGTLLEFYVKGWPGGSGLWSLSVTNVSSNLYVRTATNGPGAEFEVYANSTYGYTVTFPMSYSQWDSSGNVTVGTTVTNVSIPYSVSSSTGSSGFWPFGWIVILVGVSGAAAVLIAVALVMRARRRPPPSSPGST